MLKSGESVKIYSRNREWWQEKHGTVVEDDGSDIRLLYPNGEVFVIPWDVVSSVRVRGQEDAA